MALLKITDEDIKRSTPPSDGWFLMNIVDHKEEIQPKKAEGKNYDTHTFYLEVVKQDPDVVEDNRGRQGIIVFYTTAMGFMIPFLEAALGEKLRKGIEFDPQSLVGKQIMAHNVKSVYNNKPIYRFEEFAPASGCPF